LKYDVDLINFHTHINPDLIRTVIEKYLPSNLGIYDFSKNPQKSLSKEDSFNKIFFTDIFEELEKRNYLNIFLHDRKNKLDISCTKEASNYYLIQGQVVM